ncbi:MAG: asparagine synthase (glutamine-hydrolyzing) [Elusimicrobia bacterium]|nr:asparagine synthase (glutamine-hydrolyzing) [Elusimicrobiota bacterium]
MCGICGIYKYGLNGEKASFEEIKKMNDLIAHRGPDDEGFYLKDNIALAMRRLSIIDLSTGKQPISNEDGSVWIVFNGEIYNFEELTADLKSKGHIFKTKSDTEAIIHLYEEKGEDFPKYLRGMFAVCIFDEKKKKLILARDRFGKKPLFYCLNGEFLAFSSELNSLISYGKIKKEINPLALDAYIVLQYIPSPMTIYKDIKKLDPASVLVFEKGKCEIKKYWSLPLDAEAPKMSLKEIKDRIYEISSESVKMRMISEVPLGAFLSGGIDSSAVVALMAKNSERKVKTFSIGFKEEKFSELKYAKKVAEMYSTDHSEFIVEADMSSVMEELIVHYGEPYADSSALPSYFVSKETRKSVTVALNGDGGDEIFGGYLRYVGAKAAEYFRIMPFWLKKSMLLGLSPFGEKNAPFNILWRGRKFLSAAMNSTAEQTYLSTVSFFRTEEKNMLLSERFKSLLGSDINYAERYIFSLFEQVKDKDLINKFSYVDLNSYLPQCLMTKMDIASMANSLECRSPFLDHKLAEFVFSLPGNMKLKGLNKTKWIMKETFKDLLPKEIYSRGKMGFGIPLGDWFRGAMKKTWEENCLSEKALSRGYFKKEELEKLWSDHQNFKRDNGYRLWALLMLELWHKKFMPDYKL